MKKVIVMLLVALPLSVLALDGYEIKASKKTESKRESKTRHRAGRDIRSVQKDVYYEIAVRRISPNVPEKITVEWGVMLERSSGKLILAESGKAEMQIPFGKTVKVETGTVLLKGHEFTGVRGSGSNEDDIAGYGICLRNSKGEELAEKYSSKSIKKPLQDAVEEHRKRKEKEEKRRKKRHKGQELYQEPGSPVVPPQRQRRHPPKIRWHRHAG